MNIKKLMTAIPVAAVMGVAGMSALAAPASAASDWDRLAECESNGNWSIDTGNGYYGGLQFSESSWQAVGGTGNPAHASKSEQIQRAEQLRQTQGWGAWPSCSSQLGLSGSPSGPAPATPDETPDTQTSSVTPEEVAQSAPQQNTEPAPAPAPEPEPAPQPAPQQAAPAPAPVEQAPAPTPAPVAEVQETEIPVSAEDVPDSDGEETYVVESGDTLQSIADDLDIEDGFSTLFHWNDDITNPDLILVGQEITVS